MLILGGDDCMAIPVSGEVEEPDLTGALYGGLEVHGLDIPERAAKESISWGSLRFRL